MLSNLIKYCRFALSSKDNKQFPVQQVEYEGNVADVFVLMPYGSHASIPADYLGLLLQHSANEESRAVLPLSAAERIKPIAEGEVVFFHPVTGSKIHFKSSGDIDIETNANINAKCADANITASGDINAISSGDINATAAADINAVATGDIIATCNNANVTATTQATVTAPNISLIGNVLVTGNLAMTGGLSKSGGGSLQVNSDIVFNNQADFDGGINANSTSIDDSHTHSGVQTGGGNTGGVV